MAEMTTPLTLIDANVLVYAVFPEDEHYAAARHIMDLAQEVDAGLCVVSQVLAEFYSTVTNARRVSRPLTIEQALDEVRKIQALPGMLLLGAPLSMVVRWHELARQHNIRGSDIFDTQLVATMLENGVRRIYTFDVDDFRIYPDMEVLAPPEP